MNQDYAEAANAQRIYSAIDQSVSGRRVGLAAGINRPAIETATERLHEIAKRLIETSARLAGDMDRITGARPSVATSGQSDEKMSGEIAALFAAISHISVIADGLQSEAERASAI